MMKNAFPGYYPPTESQFKKIWSECLFAFDTNALFRLYEFSDETRDEYLHLLEAFGDRIWISHQTGYEYHQNRLKVINDTISSYSTMIRNLNKYIKISEAELSKNIHPHIKDYQKHISSLEAAISDMVSDLTKSKSNFQALIKNDKYLNKITKLFDGKVGNAYSADDLDKIYQEGKKRYQIKTPPGFEDRDKEPDRNKYGDLIIWKQMIVKSSLSNQPIIFITEDHKKDWWLLDNKDVKISPRPELIEEFLKETKNSFYMYTVSNFMGKAYEYLKKDRKESAIKEAENISKQKQASRSTSVLGAMGDFLRDADMRRQEVLTAAGLGVVGAMLGDAGIRRAELLHSSSLGGIGALLSGADIRRQEVLSAAGLGGISAMLGDAGLRRAELLHSSSLGGIAALLSGADIRRQEVLRAAGLGRISDLLPASEDREQAIEASPKVKAKSPKSLASGRKEKESSKSNKGKSEKGH